MTEPEAIEIIKKDGWGYPENMHTEAVMMAIDALESKSEAEKYRTPMTPVYLMAYGQRVYSEAACPKCGQLLSRVEDYCHQCGQAIDWSELMSEAEE